MTGARAALVVLSACGPTPGSDAPVPPDVVDADGDGVPAGEDCADGDADIRPGADERCNGLDDDCDGEIDEDAVDADPWFPDRDGDGFGAEDSEILACTRPDGTLDIAGDCDDTTATVNPDRPESCNGRDDDCDGEVDEPGAAGEQTWFQDAEATASETPNPPSSPAPSLRHVLDDTDCDDSSPAVFPESRSSAARDASRTAPRTDHRLRTLRTRRRRQRVGRRAGARGQFGRGSRGSHAAAGDIDGDGADDLLMSSPDAGPGGTGAGAVWLIPGTANGITEVDAASSAVLIGAEGMGLGAASTRRSRWRRPGRHHCRCTAGGNGEIIAMLAHLRLHRSGGPLGDGRHPPRRRVAHSLQGLWYRSRSRHRSRRTRRRLEWCVPRDPSVRRRRRPRTQAHRPPTGKEARRASALVRRRCQWRRGRRSARRSGRRPDHPERRGRIPVPRPGDRRCFPRGRPCALPRVPDRRRLRRRSDRCRRSRRRWFR